MGSAGLGKAMVLDASAILALLFEEPGFETVRARLGNGIVGAANLAEVLSKLADHGLPIDAASQAVAILGLEIAPMTETQARDAAKMRPMTRALGLSPGDRACLALASGRDAAALTADRDWAKIAEAVGVAVEVIR